VEYIISAYVSRVGDLKINSNRKWLHTGTFGTIGVLSFNSIKIINTGGGILLFQDNGLAQIAKHLIT